MFFYVICRFLILCIFVLFFFFKQKTAYEMRISDWSSDVCSSDLAGDQHQHDAERRQEPKILTEFHYCSSSPRRCRRSFRASRASAWHRREIGRASFRERLCPVRLDLGGRSIIKKKTNMYSHILYQ